jgi:homoserine dehydrogenase
MRESHYAASQSWVIGLGDVGSGTLDILAENADQIALKLGFPLRVAAVCSRNVSGKKIPAALGSPMQTTDWREVVDHPDIHIVVELIGGTTIAREVIEGAAARGKSVVTANKELMAQCGAGLGSGHASRSLGDGGERRRRHSSMRLGRHRRPHHHYAAF